MNDEAIIAAEQAVEKAASKHAYQITDHIKGPAVQAKTYTLVRESIIIGARLMQEKLMEIIGNENKIDNYEQKSNRSDQDSSRQDS